MALVNGGGTLEFVKLKDKGDKIRGVLTRKPDIHDYYPYDPATKGKSAKPQKTKKGNIRQEISLYFDGPDESERVLSFLQYGDLATKLDEAADEAGFTSLDDFVGHVVEVERLTPHVPGSMAQVQHKVTVE